MISEDPLIDLDRLSLMHVTRQNINTLRSLNGVLFPITYSETFYTHLQTPSDDRIVKIILYDTSPIGVVYFRREAISTSDTGNNDVAHLDSLAQDPYSHQCYLVSLGVTAPFRGLGVGRRILGWVEMHCRKAWSGQVSSIVLHVQESNTKAVQFYLRNGFEKVCQVKDYYAKVDGRDALYLRKWL